jgi:hypothetical protein
MPGQADKRSSKEVVLMRAHQLVRSKVQLLAGALALLILVGVAVACAQGTAAPRNHVAADAHPLFVQITFTKDTTYAQAVALLQQVGQFPYPWNCDDPPHPTPPPAAQQQEDFKSGHTLLISSPSQEALNHLAAADQVTAIDAVALTMCSGSSALHARQHAVREGRHG